MLSFVLVIIPFLAGIPRVSNKGQYSYVGFLEPHRRYNRGCYIRLVCMKDDPSSLCGHLYQNIGAVNKIVRLPEDCGANGFARVSKSWIPDDHEPPVVITLAIDRLRRRGLVQDRKGEHRIHAANVPGAATDIRARRGLLDHFTSDLGKITSVAF
ncbi:hypothetical protein B0H13DRAFT_2348264 [Mycena leptocephala]|nr:hypothetical protein B0H13DRAFT_2348264 [Mycena leptocephala]